MPPASADPVAARNAGRAADDGAALGRRDLRSRVVTECGRPLEAALDAARLTRLIDGGFLELDEAGLRATAAGRQRLNAVISDLLA